MSFSAPVRPVTGTYTGSGVSQDIALGFQPIAIWVHSLTATTSNRNGGFKSEQMSGNTSMNHDGTALSAGITLTATGFTVDSGNQFNWSPNTYIFTAWRG